VDVYYNGSKLAPSEFTATTGTSIVLATACQAGDIVDVVAYVTGVTGSSGTSGTSGSSATSGSSGSSGTSASSGSSGTSASSGSSGTSASSGSSGTSGSSASSGTSGSSGTTGTSGSAGTSGAGTISGTVNYVAKFTGASTIGDSAFYDGGGFGGFNSTGLGARTFVINAANARPLALEMIEYANVHAVYVRPNNSGYNLISSNYISGGVYNPLALSGRENNTDLVITTSGNVEIGNSAVANLYKLDVNGTGRFSGGDSSNCTLKIQASTYPMIDFISNDAASANNRNWRLAGVYNAYGTFEILSSTTQGGVPTTSRFSINGVTGAATFTGALSGTSATFSSSVTAGGTITLNNASANYATLNLNGAGGYGAELKFGEVTGGYLAAIRHNYNVGTGLEFYTGGLAAGNLRMYISPTGNLGLGVTPSSWSTSNDVRAIQLKAGAFWNYGDFSTYFGLNYYWDGSARRYIISDYASEYQQISGEHRWFSAPSGTAGASATFTERMRITSGGNVLIGTITDATGKLQVNGTVYATGFYESSDIRFKNILETNPNVNVLGIDVIKFTRKDNDTNQVRYGYSAQQVQSILPDAVTGTDFLNVNYLDVHTLKIAQLEKEIKELKAK
jgi:hypothetical protein